MAELKKPLGRRVVGFLVSPTTAIVAGVAGLALVLSGSDAAIAAGVCCLGFVAAVGATYLVFAFLVNPFVNLNENRNA